MVKLTETGQSAGKNKDFKTLLGVVSERKDIAVLQGLYKKLLNAKWATKFNETCLRENIVPNYVWNIYISIYIKEHVLTD